MAVAVAVCGWRFQNMSEACPASWRPSRREAVVLSSLSSHALPYMDTQDPSNDDLVDPSQRAMPHLQGSPLQGFWGDSEATRARWDDGRSAAIRLSSFDWILILGYFKERRHPSNP